MDNSKLVENFLNFYWARPETVIWRSLDAIVLKQFEFSNPMLDIGCGDGSFSFTNFEGEVSHSFDSYKNMSNTEGFFDGKDIHDQFIGEKPQITKNPRMKIDTGIDWKENLLKKAKSLELYNKVIRHDANTTLPFEDNEFETIFSNTFYWLDDIEHIFKEAKRVCRDNGKIIVCVPDEKFKQSLIYTYFLENNQSWAKILDRGISSNIKHCYSGKKWEEIFSNLNLKIENHVNYLSENLIRFWSIGLRPYSPYMIEMANKLKPEERIDIKKRMINEISPLIQSYVEYELSLINQKNCFHAFVLTKI